MDLEQYRQVISEAIEGEIEAKKFYENVSKRIKDSNLQKLFESFAKEEEKHEDILTGLLNQNKIVISAFNFEKDFKVSETIDMPEVTDNMDLKTAIGIAMKNEELAMQKYTALAQNCDDDALKSVFLDLASMERGHKFKMEKSFVDVAYPEIW